MMQTISTAERAPHLKEVQRFVRANKSHPALLLAFETLRKLTSDQASFEMPSRLKQDNWRARLNRELRRLHEIGRTGQQLFEVAASVYLLAHRSPPRLELYSKPFKFAVDAS